MHIWKILAGAAALATLTAGAASAAQSTSALHVRSGPSTAYQVVDTLYAGEEVRVTECRSNGWCHITHNGPDGWASAHYLTNVNSGPPRSDNRHRPTPPRTSQPDINLSFSGPGFGFSIGNGGDFRPRHRPHPNGRVCFYQDFNYRGASFCVRPGQNDRRLTGRFNDSISSIRVNGNAEVQVCEDFNYRGRCAVLERSRNALRGRNNDIISSYRVR